MGNLSLSDQIYLQKQRVKNALQNGKESFALSLLKELKLYGVKQEERQRFWDDTRKQLERDK